MTTTATYIVSGMTCGHCVAAVTQEITALDGVSAVEIDLVAGGDSRITVTGTAPQAEDAVRAAVREAGYDLVGATR
jgi:copper chaperone